jgi:molybdopterin synthase sulfur carrier subunit
MIVRIPGLLRSYTKGVETVEVAAAATLAEALDVLDACFPGLRFRIVDEQAAIRPHIKLFVDGVLARNLSVPLDSGAELMIVGALSGG